MLLKAIYDLAGKEKVDKVVLHYSVGSGFYFTMEGEQKLDQAFLDQVKKADDRAGGAENPGEETKCRNG